MKAEITNENKAKFFALYWGQDILSDGIEIGANVGDCEEEMFLQLKPLSSIASLEDIQNGFFTVEPNLDYQVQIINQDYLRSKGYAIPWLGLSVEEMVEAGWIKLVEE